jgi:adenosine receptor A2a
MFELENATSNPQHGCLPSFEDDFGFNLNSSFSNCTNLTLFGGDDATQKPELNIPYAILEALVAFFAVIGNALVIIVFYRERRLRRRTNYYIISLATADFFVGLLGIPFAILVSEALISQV